MQRRRRSTLRGAAASNLVAPSLPGSKEDCIVRPFVKPQAGLVSEVDRLAWSVLKLAVSAAYKGTAQPGIGYRTTDIADAIYGVSDAPGHYRRSGDLPCETTRKAERQNASKTCDPPPAFREETKRICIRWEQHPRAGIIQMVLRNLVGKNHVKERGEPVYGINGEHGGDDRCFKCPLFVRFGYTTMNKSSPKHIPTAMIITIPQPL